MIRLTSDILLIGAFMGFASPNDDRPTRSLELIQEDSAMAWKPVMYRDVPFPVRTNSEYFLEQILKPEAIPMRDSGLKVEIKLPKEKRFSDLIKYNWTFNKQEIQITESLNAIRIRVPRNPEFDLDAEFGRIMGSLIQVKGKSLEGKPYKLIIPT